MCSSYGYSRAAHGNTHGDIGDANRDAHNDTRAAYGDPDAGRNLGACAHSYRDDGEHPKARCHKYRDFYGYKYAGTYRDASANRHPPSDGYATPDRDTSTHRDSRAAGGDGYAPSGLCRAYRRKIAHVGPYSPIAHGHAHVYSDP